MMRFLKKYHKWLGIIISIFLIVFSISGIILNHRDLLSHFDINRNILPLEYHYHNWNNASIRGSIKTEDNRIFLYGNIGIWQTDSLFSTFSDFNKGFPKGIDHRKISKLIQYKNKLFAATLFGLYRFDNGNKLWTKVPLPFSGHNQRLCDLAIKNDSLLILSRSELLISNNGKDFIIRQLPAPEDYDDKASLFRTFWLIHSGELLGLPGKIIVDLVGFIIIFLCISGILYFIYPKIIRRRKKKNKNAESLRNCRKWNLKWHNKIGWISIIFLIITSITGMFLRPPLLIPIANARVGKIPFSILDSPNPWQDKLPRIHYDPKNDVFVLSTSEGIYYSNDNFSSPLKAFKVQPPVSIMGANVFKAAGKTKILVGSFSGLYLWNYSNGIIIDYITKEPYRAVKRSGPPIGTYVISGFSEHHPIGEVYFDYNHGAWPLGNNYGFPDMPQEITNQPISLWNVALEFHTARIYSSLIGNWYMLIIPLTALILLFVLASGFIRWFKIYRK